MMWQRCLQWLLCPCVPIGQTFTLPLVLSHNTGDCGMYLLKFCSMFTSVPLV